MDITQITDINELKALAYDQLCQVQAAQRNLQLIEERLAQVQSQEADKTGE